MKNNTDNTMVGATQHKQVMSVDEMQQVNGGSGLLILGVIGAAIGAFVAGGLAVAAVTGFAVAARRHYHRYWC